MAAPASKTLRDLNGSWSLNKKLTDDMGPGLKLQGFNFVMRKLMASAPIYTQLSQWELDGVVHVKTVSTTTANAPAGDHEWFVDDAFREKKDPGLGVVRGKARFVASLADIADAEYLAQGWIEAEGSEHLEFTVESVDHGWVSHSIWGFEEIKGERHFTSRVVLVKGKERITSRIVYDYVGELKA